MHCRPKHSLKNVALHNENAHSTHDTDDTGLPCNVFASPGEVTGVKPEGTVLEVTTTDTDSVDPLGTKLGAGWLTAELELSLLAVVRALCTRVRTLVPGRTGDTYRSYHHQIA